MLEIPKAKVTENAKIVHWTTCKVIPLLIRIEDRVVVVVCNAEVVCAVAKAAARTNAVEAQRHRFVARRKVCPLFAAPWFVVLLSCRFNKVKQDSNKENGSRCCKQRYENLQLKEHCQRQNLFHGS